MPAAITDKFIKTGAATKTTLASPGKAVGASSINISSATNWPTDTAVVFAIRSIELVDGEYEEVNGTYTEWLGTVSGTTVNNLTLAYGTDQVYAAGATTEVFIPVSSYAHNRLIDGLLVAHDQDGTLKDDAVATANIQASAVSTAKIADSAVTPAKRSGGFKIGTIAAATFSSTGVKAITGVGFQPKLVRFSVMVSTDATASASGWGVMDATGSQFWTYTSATSTNRARDSGTTACIVAKTGGTNTSIQVASYSSMNADGFSINVTTASATFDVAYEAYA